MTLMTRGENKILDKAMEEGKLAIASKEYEKAGGMVSLAIEEVVALCNHIENIESKSETIKKKLIY